MYLFIICVAVLFITYDILHMICLPLGTFVEENSFRRAN